MEKDLDKIAEKWWKTAKNKGCNEMDYIIAFKEGYLMAIDMYNKELKKALESNKVFVV